MAFKDTPKDQRPREKLLRLGAPALSDTELLAVLLRTGHRGHDVFALADEVLARFNGFAGLLNGTGKLWARRKPRGSYQRPGLTHCAVPFGVILPGSRRSVRLAKTAESQRARTC